MEGKRPGNPDWKALSELAAGQAGLFTAQQAAGAGYSARVLSQQTKAGRFTHLRRGIYRLAYFPPHAHEDLLVFWLWSEQAGVFSHETALSLYELSDVLPVRAHLTLPKSWRRRRLKVPEGLVLHYAELGDSERTWAGGVPVTTVLRTLVDCAQAHVPQEFIEAAENQALDRGLVSEAEVEQLANGLASGRSEMT